MSANAKNDELCAFLIRDACDDSLWFASEDVGLGECRPGALTREVGTLHSSASLQLGSEPRCDLRLEYQRRFRHSERDWSLHGHNLNSGAHRSGECASDDQGAV
jgi:hypothetical protein